MNQATRNAAIRAKEAELAQAKKELEAIMAKLRMEAEKLVKAVLAQYASLAPIDKTMNRTDCVSAVMDHLIAAKDIAIHPQVCNLMTGTGFDASMISFKESAAGRMGFCDGIPLLKFVGFLHSDAPDLQAASVPADIHTDCAMH